MRHQRFDYAVVGAGFFGARLALLLARRGARVALIERGPTVCGRASWTNQARVHNGYHYPRSLSTANGAHRHYERFLREMDGCIDSSITHLYAIARDGSATSAAQFERRCRELGLPLGAAPESLAGLFDPGRIEAVFTVREAAFDASRLRLRLEAAISATPGVTLMLGTAALRVELGGAAAVVQTDRDGPPVRAGGVFLVAYAGTNRLLAASGLPPLDLKAELAEVCLVDPPPELARLGVTVMDGPFFSLTPMPAEGCHAFTHVRYTPQAGWNLGRVDGCPYRLAEDLAPRPRFLFMQRDAQRYLPAVAGLRHRGSLFEVKAIPNRHEIDDGRPILLRRHSADPLCVSVLGSKIDSVFELEEAVEELLDRRATAAA